MKRPEPGEYPSYMDDYLRHVPEGDIIAALERRTAETLSLFRGLDDAKGNFRYAPGKWCLKEVLGHIMDGERVFVYRALCFCRGDAGPLPGFDQDAFVARGGFEKRKLQDLVDEYEHLRSSTLRFFGGLDAEMAGREGSADGTRLTVRAVPYILTGHEAHHIEVVRERYL